MQENSTVGLLLRTWAALARLWASEKCKLAPENVKSHSGFPEPWCNACRGAVILGFEQAKRYTVLDQEGNLRRSKLRTKALLHILIFVNLAWKYLPQCMQGHSDPGLQAGKRYTVLDQEGNAVALLVEDLG